MKNWTKPAIAILAVASLGHIVTAQGGEKMTAPMAKQKTYVGCLEVGPSAGTFTLTHVTADAAMGHGSMKHDAMKKDSMGKADMAKETMEHDAMTPAALAVSSTSIDLSKHVGHKVSVTGSDAAPASMGMAKSDDMGMKKSAPGFSIASIKMIAAACGM